MAIIAGQAFFAQLNSEKNVSIEIGKLQHIFDSIQQNQRAEIQFSSSDTSLLVYLQALNLPEKYGYDEANYYAKYKQSLEKDLSINYTLDALQNFGTSQQDLEDNILYQRRILNGLEWNILQDGYFDNQQKVKSLETEQAFQLELAKLNYSRKNIPIKMNQCIFWFNSKKSEYLDKRLNLLNQQLSSIEKLYFAKKITKDFVLSTQTRIAEIQAMKQIYDAYNDQSTNVFDSVQANWDAPLFDLNYKALISLEEKSNGLDSLTSKVLTQIDEQNKWFYDVRLKTYVRHSYYDLMSQNPASRAFFSAGIGATIPLTFNQKEKAAIEKEKIYKKIEEINQANSNKEIELLNEAYEYRYQLKQYVIFHQKRILLNESLRQERVKAKLLDADFNPLHALELVDQLLQVEIELLDLKQNLYIKLLKIQEKLKDKSIQELVSPLSLPNYFDFEEQTGRNCYIWSKSFEKQKVEFISEYIIYNQFDEVQLAISAEDAFLKEKIQLIEILYSKNIKVDLMIGQNNLLDSPKYKEELTKMISQFPLDKVHGLHLDIEPHTRADWKNNKAELQTKYKNLLKETKTVCTSYNFKLSIDLPLSLDSTYSNELIAEVNTVRFMCHENIKEEYLLRKLKPYLTQKEKIAIALRTEDFTSRNEMEAFAKRISELTQITTLNFHDLNRLIELDKKSLQTDEEH
ncbi:MAG: hypothetical protein ACK5B9_08965 [Flavobacteriia bacterium]